MERFYLQQKVKSVDQLQNIYIQVDNDKWMSPKVISIDTLRQILNGNLQGIYIESKIDNDTLVIDPSTGQLMVDTKKINYIMPVEYTNFSNEPSCGPNGLPMHSSYISIDDNYLYVWNKNQAKWKRIPLSDW